MKHCLLCNTSPLVVSLHLCLCFLLWLGICDDFALGDIFGYMDLASNVGLWLLHKDMTIKFRVVRQICIFCLSCVAVCGFSMTRFHSSCYYVLLWHVCSSVASILSSNYSNNKNFDCFTNKHDQYINVCKL